MRTRRDSLNLLCSLPLWVFLMLSASPAMAEAPRVNLVVELRWVESVVSGAAIDAVQSGAVVVGTAGSVGLKAGGTSVSTQHDDPVQSAPPMLVQNGKTARVTLSETQTVQWVDANVNPAASSGSTGTRGGAGSQAATSQSSRAAPSSYGAGVQGRLRSQPVERQRGFSVTPTWPGGDEPVQVEVHALDVVPSAQAGTAGAQSEMLTTVQVPLGRWLTIARRGPSAPTRAAPGEYRSTDAEGIVSRELQVRVSRAD